MIKAFIVEDEPQAIALLEKYLAEIDFMELVGTARNPVKAFSFLQEHEVDVLFLDINLPTMSGLELYKSIQRPPALIFTTAYANYAVDGFELNAVDYLLKPINFPRFLKACQKLLKQYKQNAEELELSELVDIVYVKSGSAFHKISWKEVHYLEKDENYVIYHTSDTRILTRQTLTDLEEIFPSYIQRVHKSYAVSLIQVKKVEREFLIVHEKKIPIGRTYRKALMASLEKL